MTTESQKYLDKLEDFRRYLLTLTNKQVWGVYDKERAAHRSDYAVLARAELAKRGLLED